MYNQLYNLTSANPIDIICGSANSDQSDSASSYNQKHIRQDRTEPQVVVLEKIMKSDEKRLLDEFLDGHQEYKYNMTLLKANVKLSNALVEYYRRPVSNNLFEELEQILYKRLSSENENLQNLNISQQLKYLMR